MTENNKPTVKKGSHLTVKTRPSGRVELEWDWDALAQDIRNALQLHADPQQAKVKRTRQKTTVDTKANK